MLNRLLFESFWRETEALMGERISEGDELGDGWSPDLRSGIGPDSGGITGSSWGASVGASILVSGFLKSETK